MTKRNLIYTVLAALLLVVVAVLFFAPADFEGQVLQQSDIRQGLANGQEAKVFQETTGETTRWTNSLFSGMPTFQISPTYPANSMMTWVTRLYGLWLPSPANLLFSMMLGFFIMCMCMKMRWHTALFGAVAWGLSTYFIIIIGAGHIWKFLTLSYIPPMIGGMALCYRGKYLYGGALTALFAALQLNGNHIQMTYYFLFVEGALVLAWLFIAWREKKMRRWGIATLCVVGAGGLGVMANLASLYNTYEYSKETIRGKATELVVEGQPAAGSGLNKEYITAWSYGPGETFTLLIPNIKGGATSKPSGAQNMPLSALDTDHARSVYLSQDEEYLGSFFTQYFGEQPGTSGPVYVGAFVLMMAILAMFVVDGRWEGPVKWALFAVSILAILLSWGHNFDAFTNFFIDNFPGYNKFRTVSSILVIVEFTIPLLATLAIIKMIKTPDFFNRYGTTFYAVMGIGMLLCIIGWLWPEFYGNPWSTYDQQMLQSMTKQLGIDTTNPLIVNVVSAVRESRLSLVSTDSLRSFFFILLGALVCWLYMKHTFNSRSLFACCLTAVVLIDLFTVNKRYVDQDNFVSPMAESGFEMTDADRQILQDTDPNYRVLDLDGFESARSSYFHKTIGGYHAAKLTRYNDLITTGNTTDNSNVINMLNAKYIIKEGKVYQNPDALGNAWFVDKIVYVDTPNKEISMLDSLPTGSEAVSDVKFANILGKVSHVMPGDTIYETSYAPNRLTYIADSKKGGIAVFSEIYFPWGWNATIDGKDVEIGRVDYVLRALKIPAGKHEIVFTFDPRSLHVTNTLSVISMSLIYLICLFAVCYVGRKYYLANRIPERVKR